MNHQSDGNSNKCKAWNFTKKPETDRGNCTLFSSHTAKIDDDNKWSGDDTCWPVQ